jgi:hypothetical protein
VVRLTILLRRIGQGKQHHKIQFVKVVHRWWSRSIFLNINLQAITIQAKYIYIFDVEEPFADLVLITNIIYALFKCRYL